MENHEACNAPRFELSVIEALCTLAIRGTIEIQLISKISLWLTAVIISIHESFQTALLLKMT